MPVDASPWPINPHAGEGDCAAAKRRRSCPDDRRSAAPGFRCADRRGGLLFARLARGEFDWVLALYHDQGLIAVKSAAFGLATNWTVGLPFLRTSVDHGTAFAIAGTGRADAAPMTAVIATTLQLLSGELPRRRRSEGAES
jgi:4-hydroxythreonine-4-phosphate dehydrogenase